MRAGPNELDLFETGGRPRLSEGEGPDPGEAVAAGAMQPLLT
jgi:hypothetical protein